MYDSVYQPRPFLESFTGPALPVRIAPPPPPPTPDRLLLGTVHIRGVHEKHCSFALPFDDRMRWRRFYRARQRSSPQPDRDMDFLRKLFECRTVDVLQRDWHGHYYAFRLQHYAFRLQHHRQCRPRGQLSQSRRVCRQLRNLSACWWATEWQQCQFSDDQLLVHWYGQWLEPNDGLRYVPGGYTWAELHVHRRVAGG